MANEFSKEERVAFEDILEGFQNALTISRNVSRYGTDGRLMERANDTIWRPQPYIAVSQTRTVGSSVTATGMTQLSVPSTLGFSKTVPWNMNALELRDALQEGRLAAAATTRLANDIDTAVRDVASLQGSIVVAIATAPGTYDDVAKAQASMTELGVPSDSRYLALSSRDYTGMAGNLAVATRSFTGNKSASAYEKSYLGPVAQFETYELGNAKRCAANAATVTIATNGAQVRYVPKATSTSVGGQINVDNRYQTVTVSTTTGVTAGDMFTIANIYAVNHLTKESTGQLKTFRVISIDSGTTMTISPPIIGANSSPTDAEKQYKNVEVAATSGTAAITFLNIRAANINPFWHKDSIELLPGRYAVPTGEGVSVMRATTDQGIEVVMTKKFDNSTFTSLYTLDTLFGVVNTNPEMNGVIIWGQT